MCSFTLDDLGARLSCRALISFIKYLPATSATCKKLNPDKEEQIQWQETNLLPQLLATACDHLAYIGYVLSTSNSKHPKQIQKPEPIDRPGINKHEKKKYGSDAIPISEWDAWWNSKGGE